MKQRGGSRASDNHSTRDVLRAGDTRAYVGCGVDKVFQRIYDRAIWMKDRKLHIRPA